MRLVGFFVFLLLAAPATAGQLVWTPGGETPNLTLSLGEGPLKKTIDLPSGASTLNLTLRPVMLEDIRLRLTWLDGGALWLRQLKKIPDETTITMALPPGNTITLEIATLSGTSVASIKLRRN